MQDLVNHKNRNCEFLKCIFEDDPSRNCKKCGFDRNTTTKRKQLPLRLDPATGTYRKFLSDLNATDGAK